MKDLYYTSKLPRKYNPDAWIGESFQRKDHIEGMYARVNALNPSLVIDAGCGNNPHKKHITNLVGFDPGPFPDVDFRSTILEAEFQENSADAVLALGSVQYISQDYILENMRRIISWVRPGGLIEMRANNYSDATEVFRERRHELRAERALLVGLEIAPYNKDKMMLKVQWDDAMRTASMAEHNLSYVVEPWGYTSDYNSANRDVDYDPELLDLKSKTKRIVWTWQKNN